MGTMKSLAAAGIVLLSGGATAAYASITEFNSQAAFSAAGTITQNTNWDSYDYPGWTFPGSPFTVGDLTFIQGGQNLIGGGAFGMARNLLTDNYIAGTTVDIAGSFNLFGANAGDFGSAGSTTFAITTNLNSYSFSENVSSYSNGGSLTFVGFKASAGEYIQSVRWQSPEATGLTDIQIGTSVPETSTWVLMLLGFGGLGFAATRRGSAVAAVA